MVRMTDAEVSVFVVPTDGPESDGTFAWDATTLVVVEIAAGSTRGLGYTYADRSAAQVIRQNLLPTLQDQDLLAVPAAWRRMVGAVRNIGRPGIASMAIAAVDTALWDLKARLLGLPLVTLLGATHECIPVYGSGGFTSYDGDRLQRQLAGWVEAGMQAVKMKVGREPDLDRGRVHAARQAIGGSARLFVDANGAYDRKQALRLAQHFADDDVTWFEEPVTSDDLPGLRLLRDRAPAGMDIAAGEYGFDALYFRRMLEAGAVDVLQADATRCAGITGLLQVGVLSQAFALPLSAHTAPSLHVHPCCALAGVRHIEYFHDHVRIEHLLFDGAPTPYHGLLAPDRSSPGMGLTLKRADAARFAV